MMGQEIMATRRKMVLEKAFASSMRNPRAGRVYSALGQEDGQRTGAERSSKEL